MTVIRGFVITIVSGLIGGLLGIGLGFVLGRFAPDYYRTVFPTVGVDDLDPVQAGIGLGLTQGLSAGLVIGLFIVLTVAWYRSREIGRNAEQAHGEQRLTRSETE